MPRLRNTTEDDITTTINRKFKVAKMKDGCDQLASLRDVTLGEPDVLESRFELFKTDTRFDSTAHHPEWLG